MFEEDKRKISVRIEDGSATEGDEAGPIIPEDPVAQLQAQLEEAQGDRLRALADLQNFRRRSHQERAELLRHACAPLVSELIPVLDHFEMATEAAESREETRIFCRGYEMILQQLKDALARHGLEEIPAQVGMCFDPERHEVMERVPTAETAEGTVVRVVRKGYKLHDRLLRPAQVAVSVRP